METYSKEVLDGQNSYTSFLLKLYDAYVLSISAKFIWKCKTKTLLEQFKKYITPNHLDIGVGTGYFIDKCGLAKNHRIALMDLNTNALNHAATRIKRYHPEVYRQNILAPVEAPVQAFDSISMNYLLHCLPGKISEKSVAFDNIMPLLNKGGYVFGATVLSEGVNNSFMTRKFLNIYNKKGMFHNTKDSLKELNESLEKRFEKYSVFVEGSVGVFWAKK